MASLVNPIIITGANGFLGAAVLQQALLSAQDSSMVLALLRQNSKRDRLDLISEKKEENLICYANLLDINKDLHNSVFIHTAWQGVAGSLRNDESQLANLKLIEESIQLAIKLGAKHWIGIGSQAEYARSKSKLSEESPTQATTVYGETKLACYQLAKSLCEEHGLRFSWLRLFDPYGPKDNDYWLIPYLIRSMSQNEDIKLTLCEQTWDFIYIDDAARAVLHIANNNLEGIFNIASGKAICLKEVVQKIQKLTNFEGNILYGAIPYREDQVMHLEADMSKLESHGWKAETDLDLGLANTIRSDSVAV